MSREPGFWRTQQVPDHESVGIRIIRCAVMYWVPQGKHIVRAALAQGRVHSRKQAMKRLRSYFDRLCLAEHFAMQDAGDRRFAESRARLARLAGLEGR